MKKGQVIPMSFKEIVCLLLLIAICIYAGYCTVKVVYQKFILGQSKADQVPVEGLVASYATILLIIIVHIIM